MRVIRFSKIQAIAVILAVCVIAAFYGVTFGIYGKLNLGIDFQSGIYLVVRADGAESPEELEAALSNEIDSPVQVKTIGAVTEARYSIRIAGNQDAQQEVSNKILEVLTQKYENTELLQSSFVSLSKASSILRQSLLLTSIALVLILAYVWFRFEFRFAVGAIAALVHDTLFIVGFLGIMQIEFSVAVLAAVLTIIGYSLNDTIVIFDRIREHMVFMKGESFVHMVDSGITKSLRRTVITSVTTLLAVIPMYIYTTGALQNFALTLLVGIIIGTWSSMMIASPVVIWISKGKKNAHTETKLPHITDANDSGDTPSPQVQIDNNSHVNVNKIAAIKRDILLKKQKHKHK